MSDEKISFTVLFEVLKLAYKIAYCMDYDIFCNVMEMTENDDSFKDWKKMQKNFGEWFSPLDSDKQKLFYDHVFGIWKTQREIENSDPTNIGIK